MSGTPPGIYRVVESGEPQLIVSTNISTWSTDGKKVFYLKAGQSSQVGIIERDLKTGNERQLLNESGISELSVSPDGRYLAYRAGRPVGLFVLPLGGGQPRRLNSDLFGIAWTPDSRSLVASNGDGVSILPVDGGETREIHLGIPVGQRVRVSADGKIAFVKGEPRPIFFPSGPEEVWVMENFLSSGKVGK
jgi:Tol biopolymer transport system component